MNSSWRNGLESLEGTSFAFLGGEEPVANTCFPEEELVVVGDGCLLFW